MTSSVDFNKKTVIFITGASKGIGKTIAIELSKLVTQNSIFVLLARSIEGLEETKQFILEVDKCILVQTYSVDLSKPNLDDYNRIFQKVRSTIDTAEIQFGIIFHNSGSVGMLKQTTDLTDLETWRQYFDLNLFSVSLLNSAFINQLRSIAPQLVIVNITSLCGRTPFMNLAMYGSAKAARELFFKVLAVEEPNIIVLNYSPGPVDTDMFNSIANEAQSDKVKKSFQDVKEKSVLTTEQTVNKLLTIMEKGDYNTGATIDFYDRI